MHCEPSFHFRQSQKLLWGDPAMFVMVMLMVQYTNGKWLNCYIVANQSLQEKVGQVGFFQTISSGLRRWHNHTQLGICVHR